jgi:hypothetical protein
LSSHRYFTDRDLAKRLPHALRDAGIDVQAYYERYGERAVADEEWIPEVTADGRVIISHNRRIRTQPDQRAVFIAAGARAFFLTIKNGGPRLYLQALLTAWQDIERACDDEPPPFMYGLAREGRLTRYL